MCGALVKFDKSSSHRPVFQIAAGYTPLGTRTRTRADFTMTWTMKLAITMGVECWRGRLDRVVSWTVGFVFSFALLAETCVRKSEHCESKSASDEGVLFIRCRSRHLHPPLPSPA